MHRNSITVALSLAVLLAACGGATEPRPPAPRPPVAPTVRVVAGSGATDTIDTRLTQALIVEVRDTTGNPARGLVVRFETFGAGGPARLYVCPLANPGCSLQVFVDTTDSQGRARTSVRLGLAAGPAVARVLVPEFGIGDSATFTVVPGAPAAVRAATADTGIYIGTTADLRGRVVDRHGNTRPEIPVHSTSGDVVSVDASSGVVSALSLGTQSVTVSYGSFTALMSVRAVPTGRLLLWAGSDRVLRLVNINGEDARTILTEVSSDYGSFPRFDPARQRVTLHSSAHAGGGHPTVAVVVDTSGTSRRDVSGVFSTVIAVREVQDGRLLVVGQRSTDEPDQFSLWSVDDQNVPTHVIAISLGLDFAAVYGGADISHDGSRVAHLTSIDQGVAELRVTDVATGTVTVLEPNARSPRWSRDDARLVYLVPAVSSFTLNGTATVINADGTGRKNLGSGLFSPGVAWSPDGEYVVGRIADFFAQGLRLVRVSDGTAVILRFLLQPGWPIDYHQVDWR